jgi:hypothetical protein
MADNPLGISIVIEEKCYGRREPFAALFRRFPKLWGKLGGIKIIERLTRGELKFSHTTRTEI